MKEYEVIHEIINQCPLNHSRDQFFDEIECEDPETYVREKFQGREYTCEKIKQKDGSMVFEVYVSGLHQRYTFTEI
ncbi:MAG: hypothetical protein EOM40_01505 [Clostridia bacterium]|nr:hypothetical protein [Clostridia bacterium]